MDDERLSSYDEARVPKPYVRTTPRGHLLEADRTIDPLLLEWLDVNLEKPGISPREVVWTTRISTAA